MATVSFTNLKSSESVEEYYEQEAANAVAKAEQNPLHSYYSSPSPALWVSISDQLVENGAAIKPGEITRALRGYAPSKDLADGSPMPAARNAGHVDRKAATDMTVSEPKGYSALVRAAELAGEHELAANLREARAKVIQKVVRHAIDIGLIRTRRGHGGKDFEEPADVMVAIVPHAESRAGDPHEHDHILFMNACIRKDGSVGTIDLKQLVSHKFYLQSLIGSAMGEQLSRMGFAAEQTGRGRWELAGAIPQLVETWSKRRKEVLQEAAGIGALVDAKNDAARDAQAKGQRVEEEEEDVPTLGRNQTEARRRARQNAALKTRNNKTSLPDAAGLREKDLRELTSITVDGINLTPEKVLDQAREAALRTPLPEGRAAYAAIEALFESSSVATERQLRTAVAEAALSRGLTVDQVEAEFQLAMTGGVVLALGKTATGEPVFTTATAMGKELQLLRDAVSGQGKSVLTAENVEWAIQQVNAKLQRKNPEAKLGEDQLDAARACTINRNTVTEGLAGTGKTTLMEVLVLAARRQGMRSIGCAPTNVAAEGLRSEAGTDEGLSIQKLAAQIQAGKRKLTARDLVIVDEAGMADLASVGPVARAAAEGGATVLYVGDERQFAPIGAGNPFGALATVLGTSRLSDIRRQIVPWMRDASLLFAGGDSVRGMAAYEANGRWVMGKDRSEAVNRLVSDWRADAEARPDKLRLAMAEANADVHMINERLRAEMMDMGRLGAEEFTVRSLHRDSRNGDVRDLTIRTGEELIIWRRVPSHDLNNGDRIKVLEVKPMPSSGKGQPDLMLTWRRERDGAIVTAPFSSLTPPKAPDDPVSQPRLPYVQQAYCVSVYQSQGKTVGKSFLFGALGLSARAAYVALTRHREDAHVYFDRAGISDELREEGVSPTRAAVSSYILREAAKSAEKANCVDFAEDPDAWLQTGDIHATRQLPNRMERLVAAGESVAKAATASGRHLLVAAKASLPKAPRTPSLPPEERAARAHDRAARRQTENEAWTARRSARRAESLLQATCRPGGPVRNSAISQTVRQLPPRVREGLVAAARRAVPYLGEVVVRWAEAKAALAAGTRLDTLRTFLAGLPQGRIDYLRNPSLVPARAPVPPSPAEQAKWQDRWLRAVGTGPHDPARPILLPRPVGSDALGARLPPLPPSTVDRLSPAARESVALPELSATPAGAKRISASAYAAALERERAQEERRVVDGVARHTGKPAETVRAEITEAIANPHAIRRADLRDAIQRLAALTSAASEVSRAVSDLRLRPETAVRALDPHASPATWRQDIRRAQMAPVDLWLPPDPQADRAVFAGQRTTVGEVLTLLRARRDALGVPAVLQAKAGSAAAVLDGAIGTLRELIRDDRLKASTPITAAPPSEPKEWARSLRQAQSQVQQEDRSYQAQSTRRGGGGGALRPELVTASAAPQPDFGSSEIRRRHAASTDLMRGPAAPAPTRPVQPAVTAPAIVKPVVERIRPPSFRM